MTIDSGTITPKKGGFRIVGHGGGGGKGGKSKSRTPVETPDSLHSTSFAKIIDLISEGEIYGPVHGPGDILRDIYLDGTPIVSDDGTTNFNGVTVDFRAGTQQQDYIQGFPASEVSIPIGVEYTSSAPWVRAISNLELSAVRVTMAVTGLSKANTSNGDINGYSVAYVVELSTDGGAYEAIVENAFTGKTTQRYARSHRIDLPTANIGWQVRVRRTTPNASSSTIADTTIIDTLTEIIDARLRYPMSALVGIQIDASQFQSIPARAYHFKGRIVRVPTNYDPALRIYTGSWDGTFKLAWSNNPAWVFFDVVTNERYGLGRDIPAGWMDRWTLYQIGRYCDELVPDGKGGTEPRFTCNVYIQQRVDAWKLVQDMASVFRGIVFYVGGAVAATADMPRDPVYTYTNANVLDGKFTYIGSTRKTRFTVALVSWNDPSTMGVAKVEPVEDTEAIARYGLRETELTAFGCNSQGQAQRVGRWMLMTSSLETDTVSYSVGLDGAIAMPGQIVRIADAHRAGRRIGGRLSAATINTVTLDREAVAETGDQITVILPDGISQTRVIAERVGRVIEVVENFTAIPQPESVWAVDVTELNAQLFKVISVTERTGSERIGFDISAVKHVPEKYDGIDYQTIIQLPPVTVIPPSVQAPPASISIDAYTVMDQDQAFTNAVIEWPAAAAAVSYDVQWRRDNSEWVTIPRTGSTSAEIQNIFAGAYLVRVRANNALDVSSVWTTSTLTDLEGIIGPPPVVTHLNAKSIVFGIEMSWGFPPGPSIIQKTELFYSQTNDFLEAIPLGNFSFPQNNHTLMGLSAGATLYFWARLVDKNGTPGSIYPAGLGVQGTASNSAGEILEYLNGKITSTQLADSLLSRIDDGEGAGIAVDQLIDDLAVMYSIKTQLSADGRTYIAGIGVGIENNGGEVESQVLVAADRFAVIHPDGVGGASAPFVIQGGQVFINMAFIGDATIGSAKFQDLLVSDTLDAHGNPLMSLNFRTGEFMSGMTAFNTGVGWYMGKDADGLPVSAWGDSNGVHMTFTANGLNIEGQLVATKNILNNAISNTLVLEGGLTVSGVMPALSGRFVYCSIIANFRANAGSGLGTANFYISVDGVDVLNVPLGVSGIGSFGNAPYIGGYNINKSFIFPEKEGPCLVTLGFRFSNLGNISGSIASTLIDLRK